MRFLKNLLWLTVAVVAILFAMRNWDDVTVALWGPIELDIKLPLLMLLLLLVGMLLGWASGASRRRRREQVVARPAPTTPIAHDEDEL